MSGNRFCFSTFFLQMSGFCDATTHDPDSPTPHNLLCEAKSVWEVMRRHPDFSSAHDKPSQIQDTYPKHNADPLEAFKSPADPSNPSLTPASSPGTPRHSESSSHSFTSSPPHSATTSTSPSYTPYSSTSHHSVDSDLIHPTSTSANYTFPHQASQDAASQTHPVPHSNHNIPRTSNIVSVNREYSTETENTSSAEITTRGHNTSDVYSGESTVTSEFTNAGDGLFSIDDTRKDTGLASPQNTSDPYTLHRVFIF